jgi:hypothetical protein
LSRLCHVFSVSCRVISKQNGKREQSFIVTSDKSRYNTKKKT